MALFYLGNPGLITSYFTQKPAEESNVDKTNLAETNRKNKKSVKRSVCIFDLFCEA